ncbi:MAG: hypothetical protein U0168_31770 [Nannocystaceae bacterium]
MDTRTNPAVAVAPTLEPLEPAELECVGGHTAIDPIAGCFRAGGITAEDDWESPLV